MQVSTDPFRPVLGQPTHQTLTTQPEESPEISDTREKAKDIYALQIELEKQRCGLVRIKTICEIAGPNLFHISPENVEKIQISLGISKEELLSTLVSLAKTSALPAISKYQVGAAGLGKSGAIYLGVNIEFECPLNQAIHGEQCLVANLRNHNEEKLVKIALSAAPCGHCRQFLYELDMTMGELIILLPGMEPKTLAELLPYPFGPKDLGKECGLLQSKEIMISTNEDPLAAKAIEAAAASYAAHTDAKSGVAIKTKDGEIFQGCYLENAAFNPSLSPFQTAIAVLVTAGKYYADIDEIVLVELETAKFSQHSFTEPLVKEIAPHAKYRVLKVNAFI